MIEYQVVDSRAPFQRPHHPQPLHPDLETPQNSQSLQTLCILLQLQLRRHEPRNLAQEAVTSSLALHHIQPEHMEDRVGLIVAGYCGQLPKHGDVCRGKSLHSRVDQFCLHILQLSVCCSGAVCCGWSPLQQSGIYKLMRRSSVPRGGPPRGHHH